MLSWLERVGLADVAGKKCEELSKGMQQKIQFISAVIHEPDLLILDEPFSGLDPVNMRLLRDLVLEQHARGTTIIFSTHVMHQAEQICEHVVMINQGDKVLDESLGAIRTRFDPRTILFEPLESADGVEPSERDYPGAAGQASNGAFEITLAEGAEPGAAIQAMVAAVPAARVEIRRPTLEDVFIEVVTREREVEEDEMARLRAALRNGADAQEAS